MFSGGIEWNQWHEMDKYMCWMYSKFAIIVSHLFLIVNFDYFSELYKPVPNEQCGQ